MGYFHHLGDISIMWKLSLSLRTYIHFMKYLHALCHYSTEKPRDYGHYGNYGQYEHYRHYGYYAIVYGRNGH